MDFRGTFETTPFDSRMPGLVPGLSVEKDTKADERYRTRELKLNWQVILLIFSCESTACCQLDIVDTVRPEYSDLE